MPFSEPTKAGEGWLPATNTTTTMKNYCKAIGALAAASALVAGNASAEVEYEIHTGYSNEYVFRGIELGDDLVEVGLDVATEWNGLGLSAGAWYGTFSNDGKGSDQDFDELDLYGEVSKDFGFATAAVGYISYQNLRQLGDDAQEVYFSLAQTYFGVDFALAYYWDIETDNDGYTELSASKGFKLSECLTLNTAATLGYLLEETEFAFIGAKVSLDWAFRETATLSPFVSATWGLNSDAGNTYSDASEELVAGTMLSVSF
jgi:hypothetical protein